MAMCVSFIWPAPAVAMTRYDCRGPTRRPEMTLTMRCTCHGFVRHVEVEWPLALLSLDALAGMVPLASLGRSGGGTAAGLVVCCCRRRVCSLACSPAAGLDSVIVRIDCDAICHGKVLTMAAVELCRPPFPSLESPKVHRHDWRRHYGVLPTTGTAWSSLGTTWGLDAQHNDPPATTPTAAPATVPLTAWTGLVSGRVEVASDW